MIEAPSRIEPARFDDLPARIADLTAEIAAAGAALGAALHPRTAANLAALVRIMNSYYSNLIEGNNTRPREIEQALAGEFADDERRRSLQLESAAHVRVQAEIDRLAAGDELPEPASREFILWLHREFYRDASASALTVKGERRTIVMEPGAWRRGQEQDVSVGLHVPPSSARVSAFMEHFEERFRFDRMGKAARIAAIASAHHRFNYIHPFPDGNGRVSRLMSHAMAHKAGIGAHGLWSASRGLARGLTSRGDYKRMMDHADMPRQGDRDGRGNLSERALTEFSEWFLKVCLDQLTFMSGLFDLKRLEARLRSLVEKDNSLKPESANLLEAALARGDIERGDASRITGLKERSARRVVKDLAMRGFIGSDSPKGALSLRFPAETLETLFPRLYPET